MHIDSEQLADVFIALCEIDSPSTKEGRIAAYLKKIFAGLGASAIIEDKSAAVTGSESGNLIVRFTNGGLDLEPIFFNCHMDTVKPGEGVRVRRQGRIFASAGDTVLGADDKSGIAILIEVMQTIKNRRLPHGPVEFIFTTCEEIGLPGAKAFDHEAVVAKMGYALDSTGTKQVIIGAPAANRISAEFRGLSAHAGLNPELGINAIQIAAKAVADMPLGRLDHESTANIGLISGGTATNIVPDQAKIEGEVRSHSEKKLAAYMEKIEKACRLAVESSPPAPVQGAGKPTLDFIVQKEYPAMRLTNDAAVIKRVKKTAQRLTENLEYIVAGGGSDANIFNSYGLVTAILGTGMAKVHTIDENIDLNDMVCTAELVLSILTEK